MTVTIMTRSFDTADIHVRQVMTPEGAGEYVFRDKDDPNKFYVRVKLPGKKLSDFRAYTAEQLHEIGGKNE
jgi:hypothetical protein